MQVWFRVTLAFPLLRIRMTLAFPLLRIRVILAFRAILLLLFFRMTRMTIMNRSVLAWPS